MAKKKNEWLYRALCAALAVTLTAGTAVMTPVLDYVGIPASIVADAASYSYDQNNGDEPSRLVFVKGNSYTLQFRDNFFGYCRYDGVGSNGGSAAKGLKATIDTNGTISIHGYTHNLPSGYNCWRIGCASNDRYGTDYWFYASNISASVSTAPTAKTGLIYTGNAQDLVNAGTASNGTMQYSLDNQSFSTDIPTGTDAGSYTVYYKAVGTDYYNDSGVRSVNVTIAKVTPTVTAPTAKTELTYNGNAQELVNAGSTTGGTMQYSLDNLEFSTDIPTGTDANTYRVYYKVFGDENHDDGDSGYVDVTIAHRVTAKPGKEPSCTEDGYEAYWMDETGQKYSDADCTNKIPEPIVIPATGHVWVDPYWHWTSYTRVTLELYCDVCGDTMNPKRATVTSEVIPATCTATGKTVYTAQVVVDGVTYTDVKEVAIPITDHEYGSPVWTWSDDHNSASVTLTCAGCGDTKSYPATVSAVRTEPTTEAEGSIVYTATVTVDGQEYTDTFTEILDKLQTIDMSTAKLIANPLVFAYDGEKHTVSAVLKLNGQKLTKDVDYVLTGNTATEPGTYTLAAEGSGNYQGTVYATWRICNVYFVTATIDGVTTYTSYEDKSTARYTSTGNGAWYVDGVLRSTSNNFAFTVLRDSDVEWRPNETQEQTAVANAAISERTKNGEKDKVTITATWSLPEGAKVTQVGTARCYTTDTTPDKETVYSNGTKKTSTLKTPNGTFEFNLNIGGSNIAKTLCVVTYVEYTLNGTTQTVISDVATSVPNSV